MFLTLLQSQSAGAGFLLGFWVLIIFSAKISQSHFNPAVTLGFMIRREAGKFPRMLGLAYMVFQLIGACLGAFLAYLFTFNGGSLTLDGNNSLVQGIICEILGAFFLVFIYLT